MESGGDRTAEGKGDGRLGRVMLSWARAMSRGDTWVAHGQQHRADLCRRSNLNAAAARVKGWSLKSRPAGRPPVYQSFSYLFNFLVGPSVGRLFLAHGELCACVRVCDGVRSSGRQTNWATANWATFWSTGRQHWKGD